MPLTRQPRFLSLIISALNFWSSLPVAAPAIGPLRTDELAIADRILNEICGMGPMATLLMALRRKQVAWLLN